MGWPEERGGHRGERGMTDNRLRWIDAGRLFLPYGLALLALNLAFHAGSFGGPDMALPFYAMRLLSWTTCLAWLLAVVWVFQKLEGWGLLTLPSIMLVMIASGDTMVLAGACALAQNCL
jgi:hypothetical protein